jgi:Legume lectin domain/Chitobiase/beta-hexosaminidase C-terminal domain
MFLSKFCLRAQEITHDEPLARRNSWLSRAGRRSFLFIMLLGFAGSVSAQTNNVVTQHNDISRTGSNTNETILTPTNVNTSTFGKLFSYPVDGWVYAQPLYMPGITLGSGTAQPGTTHNIVYIATEHDSLYAFDADSNLGANGAPLWHVSLIDSAHGGTAGEKTMSNGDVSSGDIVPEIGITSTPVIDPTSNTIYVVAKSTIADTTFIQRLHAIDITTGLEKFSGPVRLSGSVPGNGNGSTSGTLNWDPKWENNRASLLLLNGVVYIGFGSHGDNGPWHGWILAYTASPTLTQTGVWCATPNNAAGGIWMGGTGLAADVPTGKPYGRIFTATGNGTFTATSPYTNSMDYGDSIIKLDLNNGIPTMISGTTTVGDDFTPHDQATLNNGDQDQASGGVVILPDSVGGGGGAHQLVQLGKTGRIYVLNRENLGGYNPNNTTDPEEKAYTNGLWGAPAYWNGNVYVWADGDHLKAFSFSNGAISSTYTSISNESVGGYSPTPSVSSNGTTNAIVWSLRNDAYGSQGREIVYAHDATNVATLLYSSESNVSRDNPGNAVKFIVPTVVNGKVYVGSEAQVSVYGLLNGATQAAAPVINPGTESFNTSAQVSITDSTTGANIYYTTDGSIPTPASAKYTGTPLTFTQTTTVNAIADGPGLLASPIATAVYSFVTQNATPIFNPPPGDYSDVRSVSITSTAGAKIYYTTDGSTPTSSSNLYTAPISVGTTETLSAIAIGGGLSNSAVATGLYTVDLGGVSSINFSTGFSSGGMNLLGSAKLNGNSLELTDGGGDEAAAAWYQVEANIQAFTTDFTFQITPAAATIADGFTFTIQGNNASSIGPVGGGLGYGPDSTAGAPGIANSLAIKFDLYSNAGEGVDSTGIYLNGASPTTPAIDMTSSGVNLHSGDPFHVHITYDGTTITMTITDTVTNATFTQAWAENIPNIVGDVVAYVGFTGGTGGVTATQQILTWTYVASTTGTAAATPTFSLQAGTYLGTQSVSLSDSTTGATIYYTADGSTPTTSSTVFTSGTPISVTATETINAIAAGNGFTASPVASALYTIESQVAAPTFSPGSGIYPSTQNVKISTISQNATIYYTTDGSTPTTSSTQYTAAVSVSSSETLKAIATASGFFNSNVSTATYTIGSSVSSVNLGSGFTAGAMVLNGTSILNGTRLRLTDGNVNEAASAWYNSPLSISQFTTSFNFQITGGSSPQADGFAFVIQNNSTSALGPMGGGLGYGPDTPGGTAGIPNSVAVKFDLFSNAGEGVDSTGIYVDGVSPTTPFVDLSTTGINLHSTDVFNVQMTYDGTNLTMIITDTATNATFTQVWPINIPSTIGGTNAFVGFTGGTGGDTAIQEIIGWTMASSLGVTPAPTFNIGTGTYITPQSVMLSDSNTSAAIYFTTNGTTPTTSSTAYTTPISVAANETVNAIAVATGYTPSSVSTAVYTITPPAATPTFNIGTGTYTTTQSVTISDATAGTTIYCTTNGTTPTTSSPVCSGTITVSTSETIQAIAAGNGYSASPVALAIYTITPPASAPVISPVTGTYTSVQTVTMNDSTTGAVIHYTLDGSQPTASSPTYSSGFTVSTTTTVKAIALASGYSISPTTTSVITIQIPVTINFGSGFSSSGLALNGNAALNGARLRLTNSVADQGGSGWYTTPVNIQTFTTDFTFQLTSPTGNGITFTIQNAGTTALGPIGGGLGYGPDNVTNPSKSANAPIAKSVAVKFDLHNNAGEGNNSTGLYLNGASPTIPAVTLGGGVNLHSGDIMHAHVTYDGTTLTLIITDTSSPVETFTTSWPVNIPSTVGANTAYIGFTGATGASTAIQEIVTWTFASTFTAPKTPVTYRTATLPAVSSGPTFRTFTYTGFPDTTGTVLDATKVGDNVTFTVNVATAGTYDVQLSYKNLSDRGTMQLAINGTNVGSTLDEYAATDSYAGFDFGTFNFPTAGNYSFGFTVTGKNASSTGYSISFDDMVLTPQ